MLWNKWSFLDLDAHGYRTKFEWKSPCVAEYFQVDYLCDFYTLLSNSCKVISTSKYKETINLEINSYGQTFSWCFPLFQFFLVFPFYSVLTSSVTGCKMQGTQNILHTRFSCQENPENCIRVLSLNAEVFFDPSSFWYFSVERVHDICCFFLLSQRVKSKILLKIHNHSVPNLVI